MATIRRMSLSRATAAPEDDGQRSATNDGEDLTYPEDGDYPEDEVMDRMEETVVRGARVVQRGVRMARAVGRVFDELRSVTEARATRR